MSLETGAFSISVPQVGYCTNVHAGTDMATIRSTLAEFAVPIASKLPDNEKLGVGLWLPASAASELWPGGGAAEFGDWLSERRLFPFTINGFPYDNFHLPVVKHRVYRPTWADEKRLDYTRLLAQILAQLLAAGNSESAATMTGSISTLPIGWPGGNDQAEFEKAGENLRTLAAYLASIEDTTGRRIVVAIEPEPGCLIDRCEDVIQFFDTYLPTANQRRYLGVCHDICHSAVMFEDQAETLRRYASQEIVVGKIQVSNAIDLPLHELEPERRETAKDQLRQFAEDRYLHQTGCLDCEGRFRLVEDLPDWLSSEASMTDQRIRVHFHVPIFAERLGTLRTTRADILGCMAAVRDTESLAFTGHWEIETYAWTVLPAELRAAGLGADIERELNWFRSELKSFRRVHDRGS